MTTQQNRQQIDKAMQWLRKDPIKNYWAGDWHRGSSNERFRLINPADTTQQLSDYSFANSNDIDLAAKAAYEAMYKNGWSRTSRRNRYELLTKIARIIRENAAELATLETLANGKTYVESLEEDLPECADVFEYYAGWVDKFYGENCPVGEGYLNYTVREPVGVCALIVPWNFPLLLACWKMAPALAMGNTIIVKPSEYTPLTMIRLMQLIHENIDLPAGVMNVVVGGAEAGEALSHHPLIDKISFTGSTAVGRHILTGAAESNLKRVTLELGGKSPNIIFDDVANIEGAVNRSYYAMYCHKGEKCSEPTKLFVHEKHYEKVLQLFKAHSEAVVCGDPFDPKTQQGPQCHEAHFKKVMSYIEMGKQAGFRLIAGGKRDTSSECEKGLFIRPTIFADVDNHHRIAREEIFGPVLVVIPFKTEDEVIAMANSTTYGLAAGFWTDDSARALRVARQLDAGMVFVNRYGCYDFASPFGGFKQSGWGKEMGIHSLEAYTRLKSVWIKY